LAPARRIRIIYNPAAGWRRRRRLERVLAELRTLGCGVTLDETRAPGDAISFARGVDAALCDAVVAAGGDGTINEVMNGLAGAALPLGIVPLGTANVFAAELGLPRDPRALAESIAFGRPTPVYCGSANGRRFAMMVGIGFDARVVEGLDLGLKRIFGKGAYVASALGAWARHSAGGYEVEIDGTAFPAAAVVIAKGHYYGGRFVVAAEARLDEPLLHVALFAGRGRGDLLRYALALALNRIAALGDVRVLPAREVRVTGPLGERVQIDGDLAAGLPLVATVTPSPLALLL
jgi:YegS/Rv2252/BmrU family lipid kinase